MAGFNDPILTGDGSLIKTSAHSPLYTPGTTGWSINKDGSAEFSTGVFRGTLSAGSITAGSIGSSSIVNSDFSSGTIEKTAIVFDTTGGSLLVYSVVTGSTTFSASGSFSVPGGVTSLKAECIGGGAGGWNGVTGGPGGGGGEYAAETTLAVTPAESLTITIGAGGTGGTEPTPPTAGGTTSVKRSSTFLVTAHGGGFGNSSATAAAAGGTGSTNTIHFNGGGSPLPTTAASYGGSGGGGSGGSSSGGNGGALNSGTTGGAGGAAVAGGGAGGTAGNGGGVTGSVGSAGGVPGGGGGGGGYGTFTGSNGGAGAHGQVSISYVSSATLIASLSPVAGTDALGNVYPQGVGIFGTSAKLLEWGPGGGAAVDTNLYRTGVGVLTSDGTIQGAILQAGPSNSTALVAIGAATTTTTASTTQVTGETLSRWLLRADGRLGWGPGNVTRDTFLERTDVATLLGTSFIHQAGAATATKTTSTTVGASPSGTVAVVSVTINAVAGRSYAIIGKYHGVINGVATADNWTVGIASTGVNANVAANRIVTSAVNVTQAGGTIFGVDTPGAGSITYTLTANHETGANAAAAITGSTSSPCSISVMGFA